MKIKLMQRYSEKFVKKLKNIILLSGINYVKTSEISIQFLLKQMMEEKSMLTHIFL